MAIALCLGIEMLLILPNRLRLSDPLTSVIAEKKKALQAGSPMEFAVFGDSRLFHLPPAELVKASPSNRGLNLTWAWSGFEIYDVMLTALLNSGSSPRTIIVSGTPELVGYSEPNVLAALTPDFRERITQTAPLGAQLHSLWNQRRFRLLAHQVERALMPPSYICGPALRQLGAAISKGGNLDPQAADRAAMMADYVDNGGFMYGKDKPVTAEQTLAIEPVVGPLKVRENQLARESYELFLSRAQRAKVQVVMIPTAIAEPLYALYQERGILASYGLQLEQWQQKYANFRVPGPFAVSYPVDSYLDPAHLNTRGADRHIEQCAEILSDVHF